MAECELCKETRNPRDAPCLDCVTLTDKKGIERLKTLCWQYLEENTRLRKGIKQSIDAGCGEFSSPCDACIVLQKLLDETETGEHPPKTNPL